MFQSNGNNFDRTLELMKREMPKMVSGFAEMREAATADATLDAKTKSLTALAIAILLGGEDSITLRASETLRAGASRQEILEAIGLAMMLGGEPATVAGGKAFEIVEKLMIPPAQSNGNGNGYRQNGSK